jgi:hypothetical protein
MTRGVIAMAMIAGATLGLNQAAKAIEFDVGPGGVHVGRDHHWRDRDWRGCYGYSSGCRVVIDHHINDRGERVTVRRRICD